MRVLMAACLVLAASSVNAGATPMVLYDVDFGTDAVDGPVTAVPASAAPDFPRNHPTLAGFVTSMGGVSVAPTVVASSGTLIDKPALYAYSGAVGSQMGFDLAERLIDIDIDCVVAGGTVQTCGTFDPNMDRYVMEMDILVNSISVPFASTQGFRVLVDGQGVTSIDFTTEGTIAWFRSQAPIHSTTPIGSFSFGDAFALKIEVDFIASSINVWKDDGLLVSDTWSSVDVNALRIALRDTAGEVAIDNIRVTVIPEPTTALLLLLGLVLTTGLRRKLRPQ